MFAGDSITITRQPDHLKGRQPFITLLQATVPAATVAKLLLTLGRLNGREMPCALQSNSHLGASLEATW